MSDIVGDLFFVKLGVGGFETSVVYKVLLSGLKLSDVLFILEFL